MIGKQESPPALAGGLNEASGTVARSAAAAGPRNAGVAARKISTQ